jgi:hypothetical protein
MLTFQEYFYVSYIEEIIAIKLIDDRGSIQGMGWTILLFLTFLTATEPPIQWALLAGINWPDREVDHPSFPSADFSKMWGSSLPVF